MPGFHKGGKKNYLYPFYKSPGMDAKTRERIILIVVHAIRSLIIPVLNIGLSYLFIQLASKELWGEFVGPLIWVTLGVHICSWGNKEYLLRAFSRDPAQLHIQWQQSLGTRILGIIIPLAGFAVMGFSGMLLFWMSVWLLASFWYQSFDVAILYTRRFVPAIVIELAGFAIIAGGALLSGQTPDIVLIASLYAWAILAKALLLSLLFSKTLFRKFRFRWKKEQIILAVPFFLIGMSGMLQSRADLYIVNLWLEDADVAVYQVMINIFIYVQALSGLILLPFVRNLYRMKVAEILRLSRRMLRFGFLVSVAVLPMAWIVLNVLYTFQLGWPFFLCGALFFLPSFWYLPVIYVLYKKQKERTVLWINLLGVAFNVVFNLLLIGPMGILGALIATVIAQWVMLLVYIGLRKTRLQTDEAVVPGM